MNYSQTVLPILRETRPLLLPHWGTAEVINQKGAASFTIVTQLDLDVETLISTKLKQLDPTIPFVGEEGGGDRGAERFWLMDPIDGTSHFTRGLPFCTSMLALINQGKVVFAAIYDFLQDRMYWAERGQGAFLDKQPLKVSQRSLKDAYMGWETHLDKEENRARFYGLRTKTILFNTISAGWEFTMVAAGRLDGRVCFDGHGQDYDYAPGSLLVQEAGGMVANLGSTNYDYRNTDFIAANPVIFRELTEGEAALFPIPA